MEPGEIYRHDRFYHNSVTGELERKYLVFLASTPSEDWVVRLLTSQVNLRPEEPPCFLQPPYPGYFLGVPGNSLQLKTWVDLRGLRDVDPLDVVGLVKHGIMTREAALKRETLIRLIECTAAAEDTTRQQERALRDQLARMR